MTTTLIIGANRGIGLELCRQLHAKGHDVVATCRKGSEELSAVGVRVIEGVEVTSDESIAGLREQLGELQIDELIINAGILRRTALDGMDFAKVEAQLQVNAIGPLRVAAALRGLIPAGGKIGILTSRMGSIADNDSGGAYGYRMSKAAVNAAGKSLAIDLKPAKIAVALLHPGWVRTEMTGGTGHLSAEESAGLLIERLGELTLEKTGIFVHAEGQELPW